MDATTASTTTTTSNSGSEIPPPVLSEHTPTTDVVVASSGDVADSHVQKFYPAISAQRDTVASFYVAPSNIEGINVPTITFNGNSYGSGADFQQMIMDMEPLSFTLETANAAPLNKTFSVDGQPPTATASKGKELTIVITVSGQVRIGDPELEDDRMFYDSLVLVPNPEYQAQKKKGKTAREWLIQVHNFRFVT